MNSNNFLNEIVSFSKSKLKKSSTKISYSNGRQFIYKDGVEKEVQDLNDDQLDSSVIYWSNKCGFLVDLVPDLSIDEIIPRLFLSGDDAATNLDILKSKNITHILNLTSNVPNRYEPMFKYKKISIYDLPSQDIINYFNEAFEFIDKALENDSHYLLVHCNAGISRSCSFVIGYIMYKKIAFTYDQALEMVKFKRSKVCPNQGFVKQLISYQEKMNE